MFTIQLRGKVVQVAKEGDEILLSDSDGNDLSWVLSADEFEDVCQAIASHGDDEFHGNVNPHDNDAVQQLINTINATGGVLPLPNGLYAPMGDPEWTDLGEAYIAACSERGLVPILAAGRGNGKIRRGVSPPPGERKTQKTNRPRRPPR